MWGNKVQAKVPVNSCDDTSGFAHSSAACYLSCFVYQSLGWCTWQTCTCLSLLSAVAWLLDLLSVLCSQGSAPKCVSVTRVPRSIPVPGDLAGFLFKAAVFSPPHGENCGEACVRVPIKPIRWRLSATRIKYTGADKQMLTVSVSRHLPVCFLRCALLTRALLGAHLLLFALTAFSLSQIREVHLGFSLLFANLWLFWLSPWECPCPQTTGKMQMFGLLRNRCPGGNCSLPVANLCPEARKLNP